MLDPSQVNEIKKKLNASSNIVLTCHVRPDGDAIGSTLGLALLLNSIGKKSRVVTPDQPPRSLNFLPGISDIVPLSVYPEFAPQLIRDADLIINCDYNNLGRIDDLAPYVENAKSFKLLIDHHKDPADFNDIVISMPDMSSTCELTFRLICALGLADKIDKNIATCLITGLITDTRNLEVNCSDSEIYLIMYELIKHGVDKRKIVEEALGSMTKDAFNLRLHALNHNLTLFNDLHMAVITLDNEELKEYRYIKGDTEGLVNEPLKIKGIKASFFLREDKDCIKISARSKDAFPVSEVCKDLFGGGGHLQAAGGEFYGNLLEARKILFDALPLYAEKYLNVKNKKHIG